EHHCVALRDDRTCTDGSGVGEVSQRADGILADVSVSRACRIKTAALLSDVCVVTAGGVLGTCQIPEERITVGIASRTGLPPKEGVKATHLTKSSRLTS